MALKSIAEVCDAEIEGRYRLNTWRKVPSQITTTGVWFDLSLSPGNPVPKYWFDAPPGIAKTIAQSTDGGIYHGANVSPLTKYLRSTTATTVGVGSVP
jgi:hypothetical protein